MAKVFDILEQNKKTIPTQQLAGQVGLAAAPTSAVGTGTLGGTPQQQAMAGTPAQRKSVLEAVTKVARPGVQETELQQARLLRAPTAASAADEATKAKAAAFTQSLGTFGAKVTEWIDSAMKKVTGTATGVTPAAGATTGQAVSVAVNTKDAILAAMPADKQKDAADILKKLADPNTPKTNLPQLEVDLNTLAGRDVTSQLSAEQKKELYQPVAGTIATAGGQAISSAIRGPDDKLTVSDIQTLGTTPAELSQLLGIPEADIGALTIGDLQNKLAAAGQETFAPVQTTTAGLSSGYLSSTERAALRDTLRTLEETGVAGAATQFESLLKDIDQGTQVSIGGQKYTVEEIASSQQMTDIINNFITNPKFATELTAAEPELAAWIGRNKTALEAAVAQSVGATTQLKQTQEQIKKQVAGIDPGLVKTLSGIDIGQLQAVTLDASKFPPALTYLTQLPPEQKGVAGANIKSLIDAGVDVKAYDAATIADMDLTNLNGKGAQYAAHVRDTKAAASEMNPEKQLDAVIAGDYDIEDIDSMLSDASTYQALGIDSGMRSVKELDLDNDNKLSDTELSAANKNINAIPSYDAWRKGTVPSRLTIQQPQLNTDQQLMFSAAKDGTITADEVANISTESLNNFLSSVTKPEFKQSLTDIINSRKPPATPEQIVAELPEDKRTGVQRTIDSIRAEGKDLWRRLQAGDQAAWVTVAAMANLSPTTFALRKPEDLSEFLRVTSLPQTPLLRKIADFAGVTPAVEKLTAENIGKAAGKVLGRK